MSKLLKWFYTVSPPKGGLRLGTAKIGYGNMERDDVVFENDGFQFYTENDELKIQISSKRRNSSRGLRRFLRNYCKSQGGTPRSFNYWVTSYR